MGNDTVLCKIPHHASPLSIAIIEGLLGLRSCCQKRWAPVRLKEHLLFVGGLSLAVVLSCWGVNRIEMLWKSHECCLAPKPAGCQSWKSRGVIGTAEHLPWPPSGAQSPQCWKVKKGAWKARQGSLPAWITGEAAFESLCQNLSVHSKVVKAPCGWAGRRI